MITRAVILGVAGAAVAVASIAGCSNSSTGSSPTSGTSEGFAAAGATTVLVDGQKQNVTGQVACTAAGSNTNVGIGDPSTGVGAVVSNDSPPVVHSVGLGSANGVTLGYSDAASGQGNAAATKTGNSYKITGTAIGMDTSSQQQVTKSFEMDVTCP